MGSAGSLACVSNGSKLSLALGRWITDLDTLIVAGKNSKILTEACSKIRTYGGPVQMPPAIRYLDPSTVWTAFVAKLQIFPRATGPQIKCRSSGSVWSGVTLPIIGAYVQKAHSPSNRRGRIYKRHPSLNLN
jgi:hypothetical protein